MVREVQDGRRFYDHELSAFEPAKSERPDGASGGSSGSFTARSLARPSSSLGERLVENALYVNRDTKVEGKPDAHGEVCTRTAATQPVLEAGVVAAIAAAGIARDELFLQDRWNPRTTGFRPLRPKC